MCRSSTALRRGVGPRAREFTLKLLTTLASNEAPHRRHEMHEKHASALYYSSYQLHPQAAVQLKKLSCALVSTCTLF